MKRWKTKAKSMAVGLSFSLFLFLPTRAVQAQERALCWASGLAELVLPGLGYAVNGSYREAVIWGGLRWTNRMKIRELEEEHKKRYGTDPGSGISTEDTKENGVGVAKVHTNRIGFQYNGRLTMDTYLGVIGYWDLVQHGCQPSTQSYNVLLAPLDVMTWGRNPFVLGPLAFALYNYTAAKKEPLSKDHNETYLEGLSRDEYVRDQVFQRYFTGIAEEIVFRDLLQQSMFYLFRDQFGFSNKTSWFSGLGIASTLFGISHTGKAGAASPLTAFLMGAYFGYVYQPSPEEFRLTDAIALHSWWDIIVTYSQDKSQYYYKKPMGTSTKRKFDRGDYARVAEIPIFQYSTKF